MLAIITRPMVIATDAGTSKQFVPKKDGDDDVPQPMSESEFGRLRRAGAAARFIEVNHAETFGVDIIEAGVLVTGPEPGASEIAATFEAAIPAEKPKGGRKPKA